MPETEVDEKQRRLTFSWWVIPTAMFLMILMSVLVPHLVRKRTISRLEALGATVHRAAVENWIIPIDRVPGLRNLSKLPVQLLIDGRPTAGQCSEIFRIAALLPSLRDMELTDSQVLDANLTTLAAWPELTSLSLSNTKVTNACLTTIAQCPKLKYLNLSNTLIDDHGLTLIAGMTGLKHLELTGTQITSAGLAHLTSLKKLSVLGLSNTDVSEAAVEQLVKSVPQLQVTDD